MTALSLFPRQVAAARRGNAGQAALAVVVAIGVILSLLLAVVYVNHFGGEKVAAANSADAIALSAATWEARGLNLVAALNDGILQCLRAIHAIAVVWAAMAALACTGYGVPAFLAYSKYARRVVKSYWRCAKQLAEWSRKVRKVTPGLVLAETASLSRKLSVKGVLSPFDPAGEHDGENTLELHLKDGRPVGVLDAMGPIKTLRQRLGSGKWAGTVAAVIDSVVREVIGADGEPIRLLEPEDDLPRRQNVRFSGLFTPADIPVPYLPWARREPIAESSAAEVYGGDVAVMTWKSRLFETEARGDAKTE